MQQVQTEKVPLVIIGAGVVGCAVAHEFAINGIEPLVLERGPRIAEGTTSRNSGVIHSGIYYKPDSLKAQSCIRGKALLYEWCQAHGVPFRNTGKWIIGTKLEEDALQDLLRNALASGATGLTWGTAEQIAADLPGVRAEIGLFAAETGIVDPFEYTRSFQLAAEERGAQFLFNTNVREIAVLAGGGFRLGTTRGEIDAELVVNASGLYVDEVAALAGISKYKVFPCRGDYFRFSSPQRYSRLIYPVKKKGGAGLGIHLTLALDGSYRLGPDVQYVSSKEDFSPPERLEEKLKAFHAAACSYFGDVRIEQLSYDSCGLRPKLRAPTESDERDFIISQDLPGFLNLVGIESPGLTASRDLAQRAFRIATGS